jgi:hypothetical protein
MSQRSVEVLLGKLLTDEQFRRSFFPARTSADRTPDFGAAESQNLELTPIERSALSTLRRHRFELIAQTIDPRISRSCGLRGAECPEDSDADMGTRPMAKEEGLS